LTDKMEKDNEKEFYEGVAKTANFVNKRLGDADAPTGLNNTVEEYADDDKGKR
jgi:hypothetical protein